MNPFPQYIPGSEKKWPADGWIIETPGFCKRADHSTCAKFYSSIQDKKGIHACPYGYACYSSGDGTFFSGLNVKGVAKPERIEPRSRPAYYPELTPSDLQAVVARYGKAIEPFVTINKELPQLVQSVEEVKKSSLSSRNLAWSIAHEIRSFNRDLKSSAEEILWQVDKNEHPDIGIIQEKGQTIFALSSLVSIRLSALDFDNNPAAITVGGAAEQQFYSKFYKARQCLTEWAYRNGRKRINIFGNCFKRIQMYQIFELLPFLLLENAVKFAPIDHEIRVEFERSDGKNFVIVRSYGPPVEKEELAKLGMEAFRAKAAQQYNKSGTGLGLHMVKKIADLHKLHVEFDSFGEILTIDSQQFRCFTAKVIY